MGPKPSVGRRACLAATLTILASGSRAKPDEAGRVRLGIVKFGTVQWVADVVQRNALDARHGFALETLVLADTGAGRVALLARAVDLIVSDWIFAATQRSAGTALCFAPFSTATGGIMVPAASRLNALADLAGHRLGVAGGPLDKSWLVVRAASQRIAGLDLAHAAQVVYGAPPLLAAKLQQGELDAVLTFWNFAAQLEAKGCRQAISIADCAQAVGLPRAMPLVGFVFHQDWALANQSAIDGFLAAVAEADALLGKSAEEWRRIRRLMRAADDALFAALRARFLDGVPHVSAQQQQQAAGRFLDLLLATGGAEASFGLHSLPEGVFWPTPYG